MEIKLGLVNMVSKDIYEYLTTADWFGSLEKGTRLYYNFSRGGYIYHYERTSTSNDERYSSNEFSSYDYFISVDIADEQIRRGALLPGPLLGAIEEGSK